MWIFISATYDQTGAVDYRDAVDTAKADYKRLILRAGITLPSTIRSRTKGVVT
jgi:hypothetical protein